jgi:hypothetical protein
VPCRRTLREAVKIWRLSPSEGTRAKRCYRLARRLFATQLQAVIAALREVNMSWKLIARGLSNTPRTGQRRFHEFEIESGASSLEAYLLGLVPIPRRRRRRPTPQERPFNRPSEGGRLCD